MVCTHACVKPVAGEILARETLGRSPGQAERMPNEGAAADRGPIRWLRVVEASRGRGR